MFDWARGSLLKQLIGQRKFNASWDPLNTIWLKNWSVPWVLGLVEFTKDMKVLDVGSATPILLRHLHRQFGCAVHALDVEPDPQGNPNFGCSRARLASFPEVQFHFGLAGDDVLPAAEFDLVSCISVVEHTYDRVSPLDPDRPLAHVNVLRDLVRLLKPGGILLMNWDVCLVGMPHQVGWDYEVDFALLRHCGLNLASTRRRLRCKEYIHDHPDSLFFDRVGMVPHAPRLDLRATSINTLWRKPGHGARAVLAIDPALERCYFPDEEVTSEPACEDRHGTPPTTEEIDARFRGTMDRIAETLQGAPLAGQVTGPLKRCG